MRKQNTSVATNTSTPLYNLIIKEREKQKLIATWFQVKV